MRVTGANTGGSLDSTSAQTATVAAASGGGGGGGGLTSAQIKARIVGQLAPKGAAASIEQLLAKGYYNLTFTAPTGGSATIAWYFLPSGARLLAAAGNAAPKPVLVASGKHSFSKAGKATIKLTLTGAAKSLLRKHSSLKITGKVTFKPSGKATVTATKAFTLKK